MKKYNTELDQGIKEHDESETRLKRRMLESEALRQEIQLLEQERLET